jgi:hypothetical protein
MTRRGNRVVNQRRFEAVRPVIVHDTTEEAVLGVEADTQGQAGDQVQCDQDREARGLKAERSLSR